MTTVQEEIPDRLRADVDAALAWWNDRQDLAFEVTGIVDPEATLETTDARVLRLVLCGDDRCEQRAFRVTETAEGHEVDLLDPGPEAADGKAGPAQLDPPPGALRGWLDHALAQHAFVVLVFYRGFW